MGNNIDMRLISAVHGDGAPIDIKIVFARAAILVPKDMRKEDLLLGNMPSKCTDIAKDLTRAIAAARSANLLTYVEEQRYTDIANAFASIEPISRGIKNLRDDRSFAQDLMTNLDRIEPVATSYFKDK